MAMKALYAPGTKVDKLVVKIPDDLSKELKHLCVDLDIPVSHATAEAVLDWMRKRKGSAPSHSVASKAKEPSAEYAKLEDEDAQ